MSAIKISALMSEIRAAQAKGPLSVSFNTWVPPNPKGRVVYLTPSLHDHEGKVIHNFRNDISFKNVQVRAAPDKALNTMVERRPASSGTAPTSLRVYQTYAQSENPVMIDMIRGRFKSVGCTDEQVNAIIKNETSDTGLILEFANIMDNLLREKLNEMNKIIQDGDETHPKFVEYNKIMDGMTYDRKNKVFPFHMTEIWDTKEKKIKQLPSAYLTLSFPISKDDNNVKSLNMKKLKSIKMRQVNPKFTAETLNSASPMNPFESAVVKAQFTNYDDATRKYQPKLDMIYSNMHLFVTALSMVSGHFSIACNISNSGLSMKFELHDMLVFRNQETHPPADYENPEEMVDDFDDAPRQPVMDMGSTGNAASVAGVDATANQIDDLDLDI